jgi:hypothetical protein
MNDLRAKVIESPGFSGHALQAFADPVAADEKGSS